MSKDLHKSFSAFSSMGIIVLTMLLAACGGGGSDAGTENPGTTPTPDQKLGGLWIGTTTNNLEPGIVSDLFAISTDDGRVRFITDDGIQGKASVTANGNQLSGTMTQFTPDGYVFNNGQTVATGNLSGTVSERNSFSGDWTLSTGEFGDFTFIYDQLHTVGSSLGTVQGTWTGFDGFGIPDTSITISAAGSITGQDAYGCVYSGSISIIDAQFNVYELAVGVSNCGVVNGSYSGLGAYDNAARLFVYQVDNSNYILTSFLER